jgi:hypothetical protein
MSNIKRTPPEYRTTSNKLVVFSAVGLDYSEYRVSDRRSRETIGLSDVGIETVLYRKLPVVRNRKRILLATYPVVVPLKRGGRTG